MTGKHYDFLYEYIQEFFLAGIMRFIINDVMLIRT